MADADPFATSGGRIWSPPSPWGPGAQPGVNTPLGPLMPPVRGVSGYSAPSSPYGTYPGVTLEMGSYGPPAPPVDPYSKIGLSPSWYNWFPRVYKPFGEWYANEDHGESAALKDYNTFQGLWGNRLGRSLQDEEVDRFWQAYSGWAAKLGRAPTVADIFNYTAQRLAPAVRPPQLSYMLRRGEF